MKNPKTLDELKELMESKEYKERFQVGKFRTWDSIEEQLSLEDKFPKTIFYVNFTEHQAENPFSFAIDKAIVDSDGVFDRPKSQLIMELRILLGHLENGSIKTFDDTIIPVVVEKSFDPTAISFTYNVNDGSYVYTRKF